MPKRFRNEDGATRRSLKEVLSWLATRKPKPWPVDESSPTSKPPAHVGKNELRVTFVNHSTVLIQLENLNILTDPIWSQRAGPFSLVGPKRKHKPGVKFEDLPPIHLVLISHSHYDHMDLPTLRRLQKKHHPQFITGLGNKALLKKRGIQSVIELNWWESAPFHNLRIVFLPAQHFSARGVTDHNKTLWGGFGIQTSEDWIYFAGDTGYGSHFKKMRERLGPPLLSLLPIGAFEPRSFMKEMHMNPDDAVMAHLDLGSKQSMGIHFGTFQLADEEHGASHKNLQKSLVHHHVPAEKFWTLKPSESKTIKY